MATGSDDSQVWGSWDQASCSEVEHPLPVHVPVSEQSQDTSSCLSATEWSLRRYGRFVPEVSGTGSGSWEVLESSKESGILILTIVISGHFFISREKEVLEGFSLIDASKWLKIVRKADCMLFGSKIKNKHRMFRIQFVGDTKTEAEEHCFNCGQKVAEYGSIQVTDAPKEKLQQSYRLLPDNGSKLKDAEQNVTVQDTVVSLTPGQGRLSVAELAQSVLSSNSELPLANQQSMWKVEDLGSFIRLCLLDRNFPAFVEEVEKQLKKIAES